jgi:hypothetical protein
MTIVDATSSAVVGVRKFIDNFSRKMYKTSLRNLISELDQQNSIVSQSKTLLTIIDHFKAFEIPQQQLVGCWEKIRPFTTGQLRPEAYDWINCCLQYHFDDCDLLRLDFFRVVQDNQDFIGPKLGILKNLTKDGRDVRNFEHDIGPLVAQWSAVEANPSRDELIQFMTNLIKFSFVYINELTVVEMLRGIKSSFLNPGLRTVSLGLVDALGRYGYIPMDCVEIVVEILCIGMGDSECEELAWTIFKNTLSSHVSSSFLQAALSLLFISPTDAAVTIGCLKGLNKMYVDHILDDYPKSAILIALKSCSQSLDIQVARFVLECTILCLTKAGYVDFDSAVVIFKETIWIWTESDGEHMHFLSIGDRCVKLT